MSQTDAGSNKGNNGGQVRFIPIHVEGRDEPVVNKEMETPLSGAASSASASSFSSDPGQWTDSHIPQQRKSNDSIPQRGGIDFHTNPSMFDRDFTDFSRPGSIFERAKEFPVRSEFFRRSESPGKQVPVFHTTATHPQHNFTNQNARYSPSPSATQQKFQEQVHRPQQETGRPTQYQQSPHPGYQKPQPQPNPGYQQQPNPGYQQQQQAPQPQPPQQQQQSQPPQQQEEPKPQPPQKSPQEKVFEKIQSIQMEVLSLIERVEKFSGSSKRDREYMYLDEMFTQNLCKLDDLEVFGDENLKKSRRGVVTAINHAIGVLEGKVNAAADQNSNNNNNNESQAMDVDDTNCNNDQNRQSNNSNKSLYDNMNAKSSENLPQKTSQTKIEEEKPKK